eukprot:g8713.t1
MRRYAGDGSSGQEPATSDAPPSGIKSARDVPAAPLAKGAASKGKVLTGGVNVHDLVRGPAVVDEKDEFSGLSGSDSKKSTVYQGELTLPAEDASLAVRRLPERPVPHAPEARSVRGELYPPPPQAQALATFGSYVQLGGIAAVTLGGFIFDKLGAPQPAFVSTMRRNPVATIIGLTFLNSFCSQGLATGAFEVFIDGERVFSRLERGDGSFPTGRLLVSEMEKRGMRSARSS